MNAPDEEKWGSTALHIAAGNGHDAVVAVLAAKKADIGMQDEDGWRGIHHAAKEGHPKAWMASLYLFFRIGFFLVCSTLVWHCPSSLFYFCVPWSSGGDGPDRSEGGPK